MARPRASSAARITLFFVVCLGLTGCDGCKKKQIPVTLVDAPAVVTG